MKREIKFRGKSTDSPIEGIWVYGDLLQCNDGDVQIGIHGQYIDDGYHFNSSWDKCVNIDDETVGQFTGLKDKNGKEIYEGDLLRFPAKDQYEQNNFVAYEIFWHDNDRADRHIGWQMNRQHFQGSLCGNDMGLITFLPHWSEKMEVIGNIHDNPELLKTETL